MVTFLHLFGKKYCQDIQESHQSGNRLFYTKTTTSLSAALLGGARKLTVVAKGLIAVAEGVIARSCCVRGLQTESLVGNRYLGGQSRQPATDIQDCGASC